MSANVYAFQSYGSTVMIDHDSVNFTGTWSSTGTYSASNHDSAVYGAANYIAIVNNTGGIPTHVPRRGQAKWSPLVLIRTGTSASGHTADEAYALAEDALDSAATALAAGNSAEATANEALAGIQNAETVAGVALITSWAGTTAAAAAERTANESGTLAYAALVTAWTGTSAAAAAQEDADSARAEASQAYQIAVAGTAGIDSDNELAYQALLTAWSGTTGANSAFSIAVAGTDAAAVADDKATSAQGGVNAVISWLGTIGSGDAEAILREGSHYTFGLFVAGTNYTNDQVQNGSQFTAILHDQGTNYTNDQITINQQQDRDYAFDLYVAGTNYTNEQVASGTSAARVRVSSDRTYYVATTGSDSNTGLAVDVPFLTIQKAVEVIADTLAIDDNVSVTIQLANGTYTLASVVTLLPFVGAGSVVISGDTGTPGNVIITSSALSVQFQALFQYDYTLQGMRFQASAGSPIALFANGGYIKFGNVEFGTGLLAHVYATLNGKIIATGDYSIIGDATYHYVADKHGVVDSVGRTITLTGALTFSDTFALAQHLGIIRSVSTTWDGGFTGRRFVVRMNAVINTEGGGTSYFPGTVAGSTATGGQYA